MCVCVCVCVCIGFVLYRRYEFVCNLNQNVLLIMYIKRFLTILSVQIIIAMSSAVLALI